MPAILLNDMLLLEWVNVCMYIYVCNPKLNEE